MILLIFFQRKKLFRLLKNEKIIIFFSLNRLIYPSISKVTPLTTPLNCCFVSFP